MNDRALNEEANIIGHVLASKGAAPETIVAVMADRDSYAYVMRQGALKSGGAFLPVDPEYPADRIRFILEDSGAKHLLTTSGVVDRHADLVTELAEKGIEVIDAVKAVAEAAPAHRMNPNIAVSWDALAYVIYTSGSTGKPKSVMLTGKNLVNFVDDNEKNREISGYTKRGHVSLAIAALTFDFSIMEEFVPLANGLTVVMATRDDIMDPARLARLMNNNEVDVMSCTPSYLLNMLDIEMEGNAFEQAVRRLKSVDLGAEAFPAALYDKLTAINPDLYIMNGYGPTEATISCTMQVIDSEDVITIGIPNGNVSVATIDRDGRLQPPGAMGELVILGDGVGRGYIGREDLTKKSFIRLLGQPAYRSGDLVRIREDKNIEFHGRMDDQVKLRGLRIEPGEIQSVMEAYPGVRSSVVTVIKGETDYLAAYFTADQEIDIRQLRRHLASRLAAYMVPQAFMQLERMPLTANGKVDKKSLPLLRKDVDERSIIKPATEIQEQLCAIYKKVLSIDEVGVNESFFELGGTSLSAARVHMMAIAKKIPINYQDIFDAPDILGLEKLINSRREYVGDSEEPLPGNKNASGEDELWHEQFYKHASRL